MGGNGIKILPNLPVCHIKEEIGFLVTVGEESQ